MNIVKIQFEAFKSSTRAKQALKLLLINFAGIPLGIITSVILTRALGSEGFGDYSFIISIFTLSVIFATFGFFQAGSRALVINNSKKIAKQYYGAELVILLLLFFIMSALLVTYSLLDQNLKQKDLASVFILIVPLGIVFLASQYVETLLQADHRIDLLSAHRLLTKIIYVICLVYFLYLSDFSLENKKDNLVSVFYLYFLSQIVVFLFILWRLRPSFIALPIRLRKIWFYNQSFGFNVYIGSIFAVSFTSLSQILIGYFSENNSSVGFYTLALTFSAPLALIPNTIATVYYKEFSKTKVIPIKLLKLTLLISILAFLGLWLVLEKFIIVFYGEGFISVVKLSYIVSIGVLIHGFADVYNRFLGANGQSVPLRNSAIIIGIIAMISSMIFIPYFGGFGAAISKLIVALLYLTIIYIYYYNYIKRCNKEL